MLQFTQTLATPLVIHDRLRISTSRGIGQGAISQTDREPKYKSQQKFRAPSKQTSRRALSLARAVHASIKAERKFALAHICEMEEYLGLLRINFQTLDDRMREADEQICDTRLVLNADGITEYSLSDDEDCFPAPPTSDHTQHDGDSSPSACSSSASYSDNEDEHTSSSPQLGTDRVEVAGVDVTAGENGIEHTVIGHSKIHDPSIV